MSKKVSNFLPDSRRREGASFEYDAVFGKDLNPGLIRGLSTFVGFQ
jgi:hypothetical protein